MNCPKCGMQNEEDAVFCAGCGTKLTEQTDTDSVDTESMADAGKSGSFLPAKMIGAAVAVVVIILLFSSLGGGSYKKPIKSAVKCLNKQETDLDTYADLVLPKFGMDAYKDIMKVIKDTEYGEDALDNLSDNLEDEFDDLEDTYGKRYKVSYKIDDKDKLDKDDLEDIEDSYKDFRDYLDRYDEDSLDSMVDMDIISKSQAKKLNKAIKKLNKDLKKVKVSKGYKLEIELKIKGKEDDDDTDIEVNVVKINGKWVLDITSGDAMSLLNF